MVVPNQKLLPPVLRHPRKQKPHPPTATSNHFSTLLADLTGLKSSKIRCASSLHNTHTVQHSSAQSRIREPQTCTVTVVCIHTISHHGPSVIIDLFHEEKKRLFMGWWVEESFVMKNIDSWNISPFQLSSQYTFSYFSFTGVGGWGRVISNVFRFVKIIDNSGWPFMIILTCCHHGIEIFQLWVLGMDRMHLLELLSTVFKVDTPLLNAPPRSMHVWSTDISASNEFLNSASICSEDTIVQLSRLPLRLQWPLPTRDRQPNGPEKNGNL